MYPHISKAPALQRISDDLKEKRLAWQPTIKSKITSPLSVTPDLLPASWNSSAGISPQYATLWLPKLPGWAIDTGRPKKFPVSIVPLGVLRRSWQSPPPRRLWPHPPLVHIRSYSPYLRAFNWKALWSLDLAGKDLQRWWRLLHHSIACNSYRHLLDRTVAPTCSFCSGYEDRYHFVVGCPFKTYLWLVLIQHFNFSAAFPNIEAIWMGLTFDPNCPPLLDDHLLFLGHVFSTIWTYHYQCTLTCPAAIWVHQVPLDRAIKTITQG
ncbi:hypothetical protein HMPREF1544_11308 [Mucor circinelloides 1006PhL]|uniref:Reverse transcriptase zinc-binding domain-containing protein n=1 Tax=Mucor circinelloides f. circinelloides (strain 1006PhL) TaxID=1220926 RepID=S2JQD6_MUCC1|nr:hypothetical protein HMPREF1544_11308 [Mucor circinelloides 1006PhL]